VFGNYEGWATDLRLVVGRLLHGMVQERGCQGVSDGLGMAQGMRDWVVLSDNEWNVVVLVRNIWVARLNEKTKKTYYTFSDRTHTHPLGAFVAVLYRVNSSGLQAAGCG